MEIKFLKHVLGIFPFYFFFFLFTFSLRYSKNALNSINFTPKNGTQTTRTILNKDKNKWLCLFTLSENGAKAKESIRKKKPFRNGEIFISFMFSTCHIDMFGFVTVEFNTHRYFVNL